MKIAIVNWPLNDIGGINSWCINFQKGLRRLGIDNQLFYATSQTRMKCSEDKELVKSRYSVLPSYHISYLDEFLKDTIARLDCYDLIVMMHPSPHPTKGNLARKGCDNWRLLYSVTKAPKLVIFHDMWWDSNNKWLEDVAPYVDACLAAQRLFVPSVERYPADCPKTWEYFPMDLDTARVLCKKQQKFKVTLVATQWLKLKNHHKFLPQLANVTSPVHLYGNGQEYYTLRNSGVLTSVIRIDHTTGTIHNRDSPHRFYGYVSYNDLLARLSQATQSIDLSIKGHTNMTHWEPLTVNTVSMVERRVVENEYCQIPPDCCFVYDLDSAGQAIDSLQRQSHLRRQITKQARKFVQRCECREQAQRILRWLGSNGVIRYND